MIPTTTPTTPTPTPTPPPYFLLSVDIGIKNFAWAVFEIHSSPTTIVKFVTGGVRELVGNYKKGRVRDFDVVCALTKWASEVLVPKFKTSPDDQLVIEQQVQTAKLNRILSFVLGSMWYPNKVTFVPSNRKFTGMPAHFFPSNVTQETVTDGSYKERKQASVDLAQNINRVFLKSQTIDEIFDSLDKKDDFADAICQAVYLCTTEEKKRRKKKRRLE